MSQKKILYMRALLLFGILLILVVPYLVVRMLGAGDPIFSSTTKSDTTTRLPDNTIHSTTLLQTTPKVSSAASSLSSSSVPFPTPFPHTGSNLLPGDLGGVKPLPAVVPPEPGFLLPSLPTGFDSQVFPSPSPENIESDEEENSPYFRLISGETPPDGWITPVISIQPADASTPRIYFNIRFDNLSAYKDRYAGYAYRIECVSHPDLNSRQTVTPAGLPGELMQVSAWQRLDASWMGIMTFYDLCLQAKGLFYTLPMKYYTTFQLEESLQLMPGMKIKYRLFFTREGFDQVFEKTVILTNGGGV
ncbi:MAG TPA: hypothetical protein DD727_03910 [Clostridiales bacterium]|nr:hypothetical protein [Clostridiales bacterium]